MLVKITSIMKEILENCRKWHSKKYQNSCFGHLFLSKSEILVRAARPKGDFALAATAPRLPEEADLVWPEFKSWPLAKYFFAQFLDFRNFLAVQL